MAQQVTPDIAADVDLPAETPEHVREVARALTRTFPGALFDAEPTDYNVAWRLAIVSDRFDGLEESESHRLVWKTAEAVLTEDQLFSTFFWPLGASEFEQMQEDQRAEG